MRKAAPATPLAAVQAVWAEAVGERIDAEARPVAERDGVVTISCSSTIWAQELDLLSPELLRSLEGALPAASAPRSLRFTTIDPPA
jgi:predicted nucleic acid-binding Zn ribbon protein